VTHFQRISREKKTDKILNKILEQCCVKCDHSVNFSSSWARNGPKHSEAAYFRQIIFVDLFLPERTRKTRKMAQTEFCPALLGTDEMPTREKRACLTFETPLDMGLRLEQYISSFREGREKLDKGMPIHFPR
jgi:hypothetical protein